MENHKHAQTEHGNSRHKILKKSGQQWRKHIGGVSSDIPAGNVLTASLLQASVRGRSAATDKHMTQ